jgi:hypothetical protein
MSYPDVRWRQRFQSFLKAFAQLSKAGKLAKERELSDLEEQGLIQAFEFTHELAWKTLKDFLESRGTKSLYGSKDATREAFSMGLIEEGDQTEDEIAEAIISQYLAEFEKFSRRFAALESAEP